MFSKYQFGFRKCNSAQQSFNCQILENASVNNRVAFGDLARSFHDVWLSQS